MFRDREKELQRLQKELLSDEEISAPEKKDGDLLDAETIDALLEDTDEVNSCETYQNFSNGYGQQIPETEGRFYNGDTLDVDLEEFSQAVRKPEKSHGCAGFLVFLLLGMLAALGYMIWLYWKMGGFL